MSIEQDDLNVQISDQNATIAKEYVDLQYRLLLAMGFEKESILDAMEWIIEERMDRNENST